MIKNSKLHWMIQKKRKREPNKRKLTIKEVELHHLKQVRRNSIRNQQEARKEFLQIVKSSTIFWSFIPRWLMSPSKLYLRDLIKFQVISFNWTTSLRLRIIKFYGVQKKIKFCARVECKLVFFANTEVLLSMLAKNIWELTDSLPFVCLLLTFFF